LPDTYPLAPDFQLADTHGYPVTLSTFRGRVSAVLVFARGLACPFCRRHLAQLRWAASEFEARRAVILAVFPDRPEQVRAFWETEQPPFPGFADPDHAVAALYHQTVDLFGAGRLPAVVLVDPSGRIRWRYDGASAPDLPAPETLLAELDKINRDYRAE